VAEGDGAVSGRVLRCAPAACSLRGTYKVGVGGLLELLLGAVTDVRIWELSVNAAAAHVRQRG
jgi:hypothetical protein